MKRVKEGQQRWGEAGRMWQLGYGTVEMVAELCGIRAWELRRAIREWRGHETIVY